MIEHETLLGTLVKLVNRIPVLTPPATRGRGRPRTYPDRLFLQALVIMIVRHVHTVHALHGLPGLAALPAQATIARQIQDVEHLPAFCGLVTILARSVP